MWHNLWQRSHLLYYASHQSVVCGIWTHFQTITGLKHKGWEVNHKTTRQKDDESTWVELGRCLECNKQGTSLKGQHTVNRVGTDEGRWDGTQPGEPRLGHWCYAKNNGKSLQYLSKRGRPGYNQFCVLWWLLRFPWREGIVRGKGESIM